MQTITKHYIDGAFVEFHGREVIDIIKPINGQVTPQNGKRSSLGELSLRRTGRGARARE
jgi:hypothetical protein